MEKIEKFFITSGRMVIADPCYSFANKDSSVPEIVPAHKGTWVATAHKNKEGYIVYIEAKHKDIPTTPEAKVKEVMISVDSGQIGIFDIAFYRKPVKKIKDPIDPDDEFYSACCEKTLSEKGFGTLSFGFVSRSGYGDGVYTAIIEMRHGKAFKVKINLWG